MNTIACPVREVCSQPASASAPLALVRVFVWETTVHAPALTRYFSLAGHPFVSRDGDSLPAPVRDRCVHGRVFEMFTLPMDLGAVIESLQQGGAAADLEIVLDLSDLPLLLAIRKHRPADPLHPERELRGILDFLPTWQPVFSAEAPLAESSARSAPSAAPAAVAPSPQRRPMRAAAALKAPFTSPVDFYDDFDDDVLSFEQAASALHADAETATVG